MDKDLNLSFKKVLKNEEITNDPQIIITVEAPTPKRHILNINELEIDENNINHSVFLGSRTEESESKVQLKVYANGFKIFILIVIWAVSCYALMENSEKVLNMYQISIPKDSVKSHVIYEEPRENKVQVMLRGALLPSYYEEMSREWMTVWVQLMVTREEPSRYTQIREFEVLSIQNVSEAWKVPIVPEKMIGQVPEVDHLKIIDLNEFEVDDASYKMLRIQFKTNLNTNFPVSMGYNLHPIDVNDGIIYGALVLIMLYVLIIFELIHRTLASLLASTLTVAILASYDQRPTLDVIISWIDIETMTLLFSMMVLVSIFSETGIFDYAAVFAYKKAKGRLWPLINMLCLLTTIVSFFLDNVTTALLITPITIKLCEVMKVNPRQILMYTLIFANIGGAITPIGDPPNVIIANNQKVVQSGVNFGIFTIHMGAGALLVLVVVYIQIRILYRDKKYYAYDEPTELKDLKAELAVWERTAASVSRYSKDEDIVKDTLLKQTQQLQMRLRRHTESNISSHIDSQLDIIGEAVDESKNSTTIEDLEKQYPIRNKSLLVKSGVTLFIVICVFFLNSIPALSKLGLGWTAFLGALLLLLLYDSHDLEAVLARVEWSTLIFFASLFIMMEALTRLGLIGWIGKQTESLITSVSPDSRLAAAIILILWISASTSSFVDNLPLTTMMVKIAINLSENKELGLPLQPLVWALSFGACFGGNGTLIASSSNIVCAGLAEQHGHRFSFMQFLKVGFPVMLTSTIVITIYLILCHVVFSWH
ncbi:P protein-like isoform X2 [Leptinotarsa decemlineata]|uniref:P protein-like isoform X2 n=1 Tax=Leptinotarsa decemlineata TaxID=7539 RepID=UPI003D30A4D5